LSGAGRKPNRRRNTQRTSTAVLIGKRRLNRSPVPPGRIVVRMTAPSVDGRANVALYALIAERRGTAIPGERRKGTRKARAR
jgi:hypothetical protein